MSTPISPETIAALPVHDADLLSVHIHESAGGDLSLTMTIEIHSDESLHGFLKLGVDGRVVNLHFEGCWQVILSLLSYQARREQLFDWAASSESEKVTYLRERCIPAAVHVLHHQFEFSGGSAIEIVAERAFVCGASLESGPTGGARQE